MLPVLPVLSSPRCSPLSSPRCSVVQRSSAELDPVVCRCGPHRQSRGGPLSAWGAMYEGSGRNAVPIASLRSCRLRGGYLCRPPPGVVGRCDPSLPGLTSCLSHVISLSELQEAAPCMAAPLNTFTTVRYPGQSHICIPIYSENRSPRNSVKLRNSSCYRIRTGNSRKRRFAAGFEPATSQTRSTRLVLISVPHRS